jgi:hypothetical protein
MLLSLMILQILARNPSGRAQPTRAFTVRGGGKAPLRGAPALVRMGLGSAENRLYGRPIPVEVKTAQKEI